MHESSPAASDYVGRFAPSPTGPLHFGSIVAALASFLQARQAGGRWLLRIEDLDPPREQTGATEAIITTLETLGLAWDGDVEYQSARAAAYEEALRQLQDEAFTFACTCTRKSLQGGVYPGTCRGFRHTRPQRHAIRVLVAETTVGFFDSVYGYREQALADSVGDFVLRRSDGLYGYHLAVVVDDAASRVTEVVRGADLLDSTPRQIYLQRLLGLATPRYAHIPLVLNASGTKLSKQTHAEPVDLDYPARALIRALRFLKQAPPPHLATADVAAVLSWGIRHWSIDRVGTKAREIDREENGPSKRSTAVDAPPREHAAQTAQHAKRERRMGE